METITVYTLEDAREILREEARQKRLAKQRREAKHREESLYYLKQKAVGVAMIILSIVTPILLDGDATASLIFLPLGIYTLFTREKIIY